MQVQSMLRKRLDKLLDTLRKSVLFSADFPRAGGSHARGLGLARKNASGNYEAGLSPSTG